AVAGFIGSLVSGVSFGTALVWAIVQYVLAFVAAYVVALIINALAPRFGGRSSADDALKLSVYSSTPSWLAGIFAIVPALAFLAILGLYGIYLLYTGAGPLMRVPQERAVGFTAVVILLAIVVMFVIALVPVLLFGPPA